MVSPFRESTHGRHVLREYAVIADGERGALIGPRGDIVWLCFPRWDDQAIFTTLLGGAGEYTISPTGAYVWGGSYETGTLIWRSRWITEQGIVECREALTYPGDPGMAVLLRSVTAVDGAASLRVWLDLRHDYGRGPARGLHREDDCWTGRLGGARFRWSGGAQAAVRSGTDGGQGLLLSLNLSPGASHDFVLEISDRPLGGSPPPPSLLWQATEQGWGRAVPNLRDTAAVRDARHAYCVLRGMTSPRTGGMTAAATTSLPERAEQGRNYDYRYAWIRDQCYAGQAAALSGGHQLLDDIVGFVAARILADGPTLRPAYTTTGGIVPEESRLGLPGYPGGSDVVGNRVTKQFQLDALGEALQLFAAAGDAGRLDADAEQATQTAVAAIGRRWRHPEAGMWELEDRFWTQSRLSCVAGLRAAARYRRGQAAAWLELADAVLAETTSRCLAPDGRWQRAADDPRLDAGLLLAPIRGALPPADPRSQATLAGYLSSLTEDGYAYRFRQDSRPLHAAEGAFLFCGYLVALALEQQGDTVAAARWFERNRAACGPPGLFSEEFDVEQRQLRGNLPQAFVHAIMLETSVRLAPALSHR